MRPRELYSVFAERLQFPVDGTTVGEVIGDVTIESPDGEPQSVADVMVFVEGQRFDSAEDLYDAFLGYLDEGYVGRKYYDDRGTNPETVSGVAPRDLENRSF